MARPMARPKKHKSARSAKPARKPARKNRGKRAGMRVPAMGAYLLDHARVLLASLGRIARHPLSTLMTVAVIGIALALPAGLHLVVTNGRTLSGHWEGAAELSVFMRPGVPLEQVEDHAERLRAVPDIEGVTIIPADEALAEFREYSGFGAALDTLTENPLPHVLVVSPSAESRSADAVKALERRLSEELPADLVQADTEWVARLQGMLDVVRRVVLLAGLMLAIGVVIIVGNTIRLDIQNRRDEIEVTKLIGATDAFIRRPFLYTGLWYGLLGALLGIIMVEIAIGFLDRPARQLAGLYHSGFRLLDLDLGAATVVLALGVFLGLAGSWFAVGRHLSDIEPR